MGSVGQADNPFIIMDWTNRKNEDLISALDIFIKKRNEFHKILDDITEKDNGRYSPKNINKAIALYSRIELLYESKFTFPEIADIEDDYLLNRDNICEMRVFHKIADEIGVSSQILEKIYNFLIKTQNPDWIRIAERFDDIGLLKSLYNNLADSLKCSNIDSLCFELKNINNTFSEILSLRAFTESCDKEQKEVIFNKLEQDPFKFYMDLISTHVRVPHYETLILSYSIVLDALDEKEIKPNVSEKQVKKLLLNTYDLIIREYQYRKDILERIKIALTEYNSKEYLCSWDKIGRNDNALLIEYIKKNFCIEWVETAKIKKFDDGKAIKIYSEKNCISLKLNADKNRVILTIDGVKTDEFIVETENSKLSIYSTEINGNILKDLIDDYLLIYKNVLLKVRSIEPIRLIENNPNVDNWEKIVLMNIPTLSD
jgi:hypothetical protein